MSLKIGDQEYSDEQLAAAIKAQGELQALQQQVAPVLKAAERYRLDVSTLVENAEGAFSQLFELQEAGILDENGKLKETPKTTPVVDPKVTPKPAPQATDIEAIVERAMEKIAPKFSAIEQQVGQIKDYQGRLFRERMLSRVQEKHPNLSEEDISILTAKATAQKKDFWELAEQRSKDIEEGKGKVIQSFAEEHGLNIDKLNKIKEMRSNEGAIAAAVVEGKKISSKGGPDTITPREAMENYFELQRELERN